MLTFDLINSNNTNLGQVEISPYILVLSETSRLPNVDDLVENGFIGVGIPVGRYFNDQHGVNKNYVNPNLRKQIEWAKDNNFAFALLANIDARNIGEAQEEFKKLYGVLLGFQPNIGLWFRVRSKGTSKQIEEIIEWYQMMLINRGFRYQIGFYNTKEELEKFDWQKFCNNRAGNDVEYKDFDRTSVSNYFANDWNLWWLDKPTGEEFNKVGALLTPNFFKLIPAGESTANPAVYVTPPMRTTTPTPDTEIVTGSGGGEIKQEVR